MQICTQMCFRVLCELGLEPVACTVEEFLCHFESYTVCCFFVQAKAEVDLQQSRLHDVQEMLRQENSNLQSKLVSCVSLCIKFSFPSVWLSAILSGRHFSTKDRSPWKERGQQKGESVHKYD